MPSSDDIEKNRTHKKAATDQKEILLLHTSYGSVGEEAGAAQVGIKRLSGSNDTVRVVTREAGFA
ncbi:MULTISPECIES: hypothetical protein [unclassified Bradyrhizobium]|uniref:hypothetical protein n=1 Tax=unclassified Bradyrhizobium TaxID=2631580 RepID=UPI00247A6177|nr:MULTISPECIES: hypothetical protein [unclassified Bradyrhizobium]WGS17380.1 hypothetical protein MTX22_22205 [Bradyrhizobium sp. ISRA463]WGS24150.1 hypothetical protein MTX19_19875 [Bradyrhizobium sp. ISRA464]